ncbi:hypothetical protein MKY04_17200 [Lysinibacillus telephonicus]|uniref:hypothetical protein n=1 Tax=Lysinibacillus telephonicus TaxID=1714840 RepID=UPI0031FC1970
MLVKFDVLFYDGHNPTFEFKMDHTIDAIEKFVGDLFEVNQCRRMKMNAEEKFYDCNNPNETFPILISRKRYIKISSSKTMIEFQIEDANLHKTSYRQYERCMRVGGKIRLVFTSTMEEVSKVCFIGTAQLVNY